MYLGRQVQDVFPFLLWEEALKDSDLKFLTFQAVVSVMLVVDFLRITWDWITVA